MGRRLTRREVIRHAALVAATIPAAKAARPGWALAEEAFPASSHRPAIPIHLELVTVTDTEAVVTWFTGDPTDPDEFGRPAPVEAPGRLLLGTSPNPADWAEVAAHDPTAYHHVRVGGLSPGTRYWFRAESGGLPAVPTAFSPLEPDASNLGTFTTLVPPSGREIMRVAWLNDLHIGEHVSGLAYSDDNLPSGGFPPGFPVDHDNPYWRIMAAGAVDGAVAHGCSLLLANGDLTNAAEHEGLLECRGHLDRFGRLGGEVTDHGGTPLVSPDGARAYFVTRGNHDRARPADDDSGCPPVADEPDLRDCFVDVFGSGFEDATRFAVVAGDDRARYRFVGLDSSNIRTGAGEMPHSELDYLEAQLESGDLTFPLFHHHVGDVSTLLAMPPVIFGVEQADAARFRELLARHDNVAGVYSGHTHRNRRTTSQETGRLPYYEGAAVKEYPGGYTVVRLFEDGYMVNFWKTDTPEAGAWSERSRGQYLNLYPYYTLGGFADRNWVHDVDARVTTRPTDPPPAEPPDPPPPEESTMPATGAGAAAAGLGAVAAAEVLRRTTSDRDPNI